MPPTVCPLFGALPSSVRFSTEIPVAGAVPVHCAEGHGWPNWIIQLLEKHEDVPHELANFGQMVSKGDLSWTPIVSRRYNCRQSARFRALPRAAPRILSGDVTPS
jgi:hypothetical protein